MGLSVAEYEQEMIAQYNSLQTVREKAQFLTDLYQMRLADLMDGDQQQALDRMTVLAITPSRPDGSPDFQAAEDLFACMADIQTDLTLSAGRSWQAWLNGQDPADKARAQDHISATTVMHPFSMSLNNALSNPGFPKEYATRLDQYGAAQAAYSAQRFAEHPEETWRKTDGEIFTERMLKRSHARAIERATAMSEADKATFKLADQVEFDSGMVIQQSLERGLRSSQTEAMKRYTTVTEQNPMMDDFGKIYDLGELVEQDEYTAMEYFGKAAELGNAEAMWYVGTFWEEGVVVSRDPAKAMEWYRKAAEAGDADSWMSIAACYADGRGTEQDFPAALSYYEKAADSGSHMACDYLGYLYMAGEQVPQDYEKGLEYYRKAAALGNSRSMMALGYAYLSGQGTDADPEEAARWYEMAALAGRTDALEFLKKLWP